MTEGFGRKAKWWTSRHWRDRMQSRSNLSGIKLALAWLVLGVLMLIGFFVGLVFLLLGWILMPLLRYGWLKRTRRYAPDGGPSASGRFDAHNRARRGDERVIEGEYQVRSSDRSD